MAFNQFMHPKNRYKHEPPDFEKLAECFPNFRKHVQHSKRTKKPFVNFRNPNAVRELSKCLLRNDFNLNVELPSDRLSPTVPSRLNYILWLQDLLQCLPTQNRYVVFDIGCGSSCIYPLLGVKLNDNWTFIASEIDAKNFEYAQRNVTTNGLSERVLLHQVLESDNLFSPLGDTDEVDVCMCNPPFFNSKDDAEKSWQRPSANSSCSGDGKEMIFEQGGDLAFAERLLRDSSKVKGRIKWFTIMFGKKLSFTSFKLKLKTSGVSALTSTEFCQGKTMRWAVAWSFIDTLDIDKIPKSQFQLAKSQKTDKPLTFRCKSSTLEDCENAVSKILAELCISFETEHVGHVLFKFKTSKSEWMHNRRKRRLETFKLTSKRLCDAERKCVQRQDTTSEANSQQKSDVQFECLIFLSHNNDGVEAKICSNPMLKEEINAISVHLKRRI
uniref:U6 small nuclear RNA (adenine-(43)-N(6))-methyltransferase n=1 Tax=Phallusia mammillata TaxID=59560 RepID=A0A6F9DLA5_9ASCI|nr:T-box-containing protein 2-like [Phallusia mammillata]